MSAVVIPNRTQRWFHNWKPHHEVKNATTDPIPEDGMPSNIYPELKLVANTAPLPPLGMSLPELFAVADQIAYGMTREEFFAKCKRESDEYWCTTEFRVPLIPQVGGKSYTREMSSGNPFSLVQYMEAMENA